jgi:hypothetical protein
LDGSFAPKAGERIFEIMYALAIAEEARAAEATWHCMT